MTYYVLKDTDEYIRYEPNKDEVILEVYRDGRWQEDRELLGVFSGDNPIRNVTQEELMLVRTLENE